MAGKERELPYGRTEQGDRLFTARRRVSASQEAFAAACGLNRLAYRSCEAGVNQMSTGHIRRSLARGFGTDEQTVGAYLEGKMSLTAFLRSLDPGGASRAVLERALGRLTLARPRSARRYVEAFQRLSSELPDDLTLDHAERLLESVASEI